jgi:hypothetical protein
MARVTRVIRSPCDRILFRLERKIEGLDFGHAHDLLRLDELRAISSRLSGNAEVARERNTAEVSLEIVLSVHIGICPVGTRAECAGRPLRMI